LCPGFDCDERDERSSLVRTPAKDISEVSDVPRTRVYDAVRVLESKGLVEIQHSNPQQFRAVSVEEAAETLQEEYESRAETLEEVLRGIEPITSEEETKTQHEVWSLTGTTAISNRARQLISDAESEVVLVIGDKSVLIETVTDSLRRASTQGVSVIVGAVSEDLQEIVQSELPEATVFISRLDWLNDTNKSSDQTIISRLLLIDRKSILVRVEDEGIESTFPGTAFEFLQDLFAVPSSLVVGMDTHPQDLCRVVLVGFTVLFGLESTDCDDVAIREAHEKLATAVEIVAGDIRKIVVGCVLDELQWRGAQRALVDGPDLFGIGFLVASQCE
jgi:sugar-specific transcriptional regulator TrmB